MNPSPLDVLIVADPHYTALARQAGEDSARQTTLALMLIQKALWRLRNQGITPGLILLLGDLVDDGDAPRSVSDLMHLAGALLKTGIRVLAVPGNHDGDPARVAQFFGSEPGLHLVNGYGFLLFADQHVGNEHYARTAEGLALPAQAAAQHPGVPLIAVQHHPIHPTISAPYPYMLDNSGEVAAGYREAGVKLSLSGHYHPGQAATVHEGVTYVTTPALAEAPFTFQHLRLDGEKFEITTHTLQIEVPGLCDVHCHSEFAYCATSVSAGLNRMLAENLGLTMLCLTEHAFHLYFPADVAWSYEWQRDRSLVDAAWNDSPGRGRMATYKRFAAAQRGPGVRIGLEVDLMAGGELLLHPDDFAGWDLLVGAIHEIDCVRKGGGTPQAVMERLFMHDLERLLSYPIKVLAHPFRIFAWHKMDRPVHLFREVAETLARAGVAAEINYHVNQPDPAFLRACLEAGTKIAFGSDAHRFEEVAECYQHLKLLREAGVETKDIARHLYVPD